MSTERPGRIFCALSAVFQNYLAGQLDVFLPTTICFAPFVNSYKRYQSDSFAGSTRAWGIDNRTVGCG